MRKSPVSELCKLYCEFAMNPEVDAVTTRGLTQSRCFFSPISPTKLSNGSYWIKLEVIETTHGNGLAGLLSVYDPSIRVKLPEDKDGRVFMRLEGKEYCDGNSGFGLTFVQPLTLESSDGGQDIAPWFCELAPIITLAQRLSTSFLA